MSRMNMFRCDRVGCTVMGECASTALECPDGWGVVRILMALDPERIEVGAPYADHKAFLCPDHVAEARSGSLFKLSSEAARQRGGGSVSRSPFF